MCLAAADVAAADSRHFREIFLELAQLQRGFGVKSSHLSRISLFRCNREALSHER